MNRRAHSRIQKSRVPRGGAPALALAATLLVAGLAACDTRLRSPFAPRAPDPVQAMDFDRLADAPGIYAGRDITLVGAMSVRDGQACLFDRGRRVAVRLTAAQAAYYQHAADWPVAVRGRFSQFLCPADHFCPDLCAPLGLEAGAEIVGLAAAQ